MSSVRRNGVNNLTYVNVEKLLFIVLKSSRIKDFGYKHIQYFTMVAENFQFKRSEMPQNEGFLAKAHSIIQDG